MSSSDYLVVGGGILGLSVAMGLRRKGVSVTVLDSAVNQPRASTANFGLVWLQSKGANFPAYGAWTREAVDAWPAFAAEVQEASGIDVRYRKSGGLTYCLSEADLEARAEKVAQMKVANAVDIYETEMLTRAALENHLPGLKLGPEVAGASWNPHDGAVDPLRLMHAMRTALIRCGVVIQHGVAVEKVERQGHAFVATAQSDTWSAKRIVLAAGIGNAQLGPHLNLDPKVYGDRGQILVTERVNWRLPLPANGLRQSADGTILIGATKEGPDANLLVTDPLRAAVIALRASKVIPALKNVRIVRSWAGLRTLSKDSAPVYTKDADQSGVASINSHSGITLAPVHASRIADWIHDDSHEEAVAQFSPRRFDVSTSAPH